MKRNTVLLFSLFSALGTYAQEEQAPPAEGKSNVDMGAILFVVGLVIFVIIIRKIYEARAKREYEKELQAKKDQKKEDFNNPKFWYQCKNCKVTIRKTLPPNSADCFKAVDHNWTQIAEVGNQKYLCRNCSTLVETKAMPVIENCPDADMHDWEKLN